MKMTYEEAMEYISNVGMFGSNYGLERTHRLLELLGSPQNKLKRFYNINDKQSFNWNGIQSRNVYISIS